MSEAQLERSVLESKEREELFAIADALGTRPTSRAKKADLVTAILRATGVDDPGPSAAPVRRTRTRRVATAAPAAPAEDADGASPDAGTAAGEGVAGGVIEGPSAATLPLELGDDPASGPSDATDSAGGDSLAGAAGTPDAATPDIATSDIAGADGVAGVPHRDGPAGGSTDASTTTGGQGVQDRFEPGEGGSRRNRRRRGRDRGGERPERELQPAAAEVQYSGEPIAVSGLLDLRDEGYGFLRTGGFLAGAEDVYVSVSQVRRFALRRGDHLDGTARPAGNNEKYPALLRVDTVGGLSADDARSRPRFEDLTAVHPSSRLELVAPEGPVGEPARIVDALAPIGRGQRALVASPPGAGATSLLVSLAVAVQAGDPGLHVMVVLVDERPEDITEVRRTLEAELVASASDRPADEHIQVAELAVERAKRLAEQGRDVVLVLDGITRLARAYNLANPGSGRIVSGGIDPVAVQAAKRFFGAARNTEDAGSLTILAAVAVGTDSGLDQVVFEELEGIANMQVRLDRSLAERRLYPAVDVGRTTTRHEELLYDPTELDQVWTWRRSSGAPTTGDASAASLGQLLDQLHATTTRSELLAGLAASPAPSAPGTDGTRTKGHP